MKPAAEKLEATAHPRSRGENLVAAVLTMPDTGSSPLTRGKRSDMGRHIGYVRLIPAHAGKTMPRYPDRCGSAAHPRSRGENMTERDAEAVGDGSSPLTRGKPRCHRRNPQHCRLIPAHAGKTGSGRFQSCLHEAHPRSRGENLLFDNVGKELPGSSPLTRGKPDGKLRTTGMSRLIPAHAGKTIST